MENRERAKARDKKQRRPISSEEKRENFIAVVRNWEMLATTKVKMRGSKKKVNGNTFKISSIKLVTREFLEVSIHVVVEQNNGKEMYKKSVLHVQSCFFAN